MVVPAEGYGATRALFKRLAFYYVCEMHSLKFIVFFFSSRRRHTRCGRDWSSDVCSSDLIGPTPPGTGVMAPATWRSRADEQLDERFADDVRRSEERRVGKECRSRWSP